MSIGSFELFVDRYRVAGSPTDMGGGIELFGWAQNDSNRSTLGIFSSNNIEKGP